MASHRVYFDEEATIEGPSVILSRRETHHLLRVRRAREGERVDVFDGKGVIIETTLKKRGKQVRLQLLSRQKQSKPSIDVLLAVSALKSKTMDLVIRQATEMGVAAVQVLFTEHSEVDFRKWLFREKKERWESIAIEACKQSGNPYIPEFYEPCELGKWLSQCKDERQYWVASLHKTAAGGKIKGSQKARCVLIGPEGDFSTQEYEAISKAGFESLSLGQYVLRSETAAVKAVSIIQG